MIVTRTTLPDVLKELSQHEFLSVDTETTGLYPHRGDVLFSFIIASSASVYYFNFDEYDSITDEENLNTTECWAQIKTFFLADPFKTWFLHNAKFDLAFLRKEGVEIAGHFHDTKTTARLLWNDHFKYSLADCVKRDIGAEKSTAVEEYVKEHKLYEDIENPHKNVKERKVFYHRVPFDIISNYGIIDANITFRLGTHQLQKIEDESTTTRKNIARIRSVYDLERRLIRPMFDMEWYGIKIDRTFCEKAIIKEEQNQKEAIDEFKRITGREFIDSNKLFAEVFTGTDVPKTAKGNPSFDKHSLNKLLPNPIAESILGYRSAKNQANYFHGFLYHADRNNCIHPNFLADGTSSGRFSSQSPNLQNLTKPDSDIAALDDEEQYEVRGAFTPRDGFSFYIADYQAQEYRLLVDLAGDADLAAKIIGGVDVHSETAKKAGVTRQQAKTTLFATLYGAGINKLAEQLKCTPPRAKQIRSDILGASPYIAKFLKKTISDAEDYKQAHSWMGRIYRFPDSRDCYRAPNYVIQGGCADITKSAIVNCYEFISAFKSRMVLTVHDSIVFEIAHGEEHILPTLKKIMIEAYPARLLPMDVSIEIGHKNMAETTKIEV
jgi:DNA polymerase I-like protein with 3'-5' exonuclease and polymerase domains